MAKVLVKNLTKRFGNLVAVDNLTMEVGDGTFTVLLGPSGCGKTTTLRCIAGLEKPDMGEIYIGDRLVNELHPKDRDIAMVFQSYALYPHMTVYDNLAFPLRMRKIPKEEIERRVKEVADLLQITDLLNKRPGQLSGGQAQRVALGRAIIRQPQVFLMDEPLSNLDAKLRTYMRAEIKRLQQELGVTTIYVTHDQVEAMTMADKIAVMNKGKLLQYDTPENIYNYPANKFVAGFIGSPPMNFLECTFNQKSLSLDAGEFSIRLPPFLCEKINEKAKSKNVILGFRPEHIIVSKEKTAGAIEAQIYVIEPLGAETILDVKIGSNLIKVRLSGFSLSLRTNDKIWISFDTDKIHLFDADTEELIV
ncbi:MAG: ABC transporter ATP-binding protein [Candidatus Bathyarchaeia archaeon]